MQREPSRGRSERMEDDQTLLPLQSATFSDESIDAHGMGGGVVPFAVTPEGDVRLLLGRERWINSWRGSCRWSGFEGSRKDGESLQDTSVREFVEESLGVVLDARSIASAASHPSRRAAPGATTHRWALSSGAVPCSGSGCCNRGGGCGAAVRPAPPLCNPHELRHTQRRHRHQRPRSSAGT